MSLSVMERRKLGFCRKGKTRRDANRGEHQETKKWENTKRQSKRENEETSLLIFF